ncbi:VOC family protein [Vibrio makurazakiensis]|uniref:VOC family protein n=1 Tax=Vibrio makurazakiensis TaxID=2910250 RepID=UPI003D0AED96
MQHITRINHLGIRVSDFETARAFYAKLGFRYITGPGGPEPVAIVEHPSGININLILNSNQNLKQNVLMDLAEKHTGYTHVALEVSNMELFISELAEQGIALSSGPMKHPTGVSAFIHDPDDNVIEFIEYVGLSAFE